MNWFEYTGQFRESGESLRLRFRCCYDANRMSSHEVAKLLKDETGTVLVSSQRIHKKLDGILIVFEGDVKRK